MLATDGTGVGEENANHHFIGWVFLDADKEAGVLAESYEKRVHAYARHRAGKKTQRHAEGMAWVSCASPSLERRGESRHD